MTQFVFLALVLGAAALALLVVRPAASAGPEAAARPSRRLVLGMALLLLAVAGGGYLQVGSPGLLPLTPDAPPGPGAAADAQLAVLQSRAEQAPNDARAWVMAGRVQLDLGRAPEAAQDYRHALSLRPRDADLLADLADVLAVNAQGHLDGEPMQLVDQALAIDPDHVKALALKGSYAMTQRDFRTALTSWDHALRVAQPGDPIAAFLRSQLDAMRAMARAAESGTASAPASR